MEYYHELAGVMVDCAIILENVEKIYKELHKYMKSKGFDIFLNNILFKLLMSLFVESTHKTIYLSLIDCLFIYGDIILHKACLLLLSLIKEEIMKCKDLVDASNLFDINLKNISIDKFASELIKADFGLKKEVISKQREEKLPKIIENIKKMSKNAKKKNINGGEICDLDWPYCAKVLEEPYIQSIMKYKVVDNILIENNYFDLSHNIYKLAESSNESMEREIKNENDEKRKKALIYGNLLVERPFHKCGSYFNSREKILGYQSQRRSSLMTVFFEQNEKNEKDFESRTSNSSELIEMIHNKSDFMNNVNRSFLIESVIDSQKEEENKKDSNENGKENDNDNINKINIIEDKEDKEDQKDKQYLKIKENKK